MVTYDVTIEVSQKNVSFRSSASDVISWGSHVCSPGREHQGICQQQLVLSNLFNIFTASDDLQPNWGGNLSGKQHD